MDDNNVSLEELSRWISENNIPATPSYKRTLLDIVGCARHENNWSDIYSYFFDEKEEHGLRDLFIRSLERIIGVEKGWMQDFCIIREKAAKDDEYNQEESSRQDVVNKKRQGRTDLLILGAKSRAIIIENKVHATIEGNNNPLFTYKKSVKDRGYNDIKGIILAVSENYNDMKIAREAGYDYITHIDFIKEVERRLEELFPNANQRHLPLLHDFIVNIRNITRMSATSEDFRFHKEHYKALNNIRNLLRKVDKAYKDELSNLDFEKGLPIKVDKVRSLNEDDNRRLVYLKFGKGDIYLTLYLNSLWENPQPYVRVILEIQEEKKRKRDFQDLDLHGAFKSLPKDFDQNGHIAYCDIEIDEEVTPCNVRCKIEKSINNVFSLCQLAEEIENKLN